MEEEVVEVEGVVGGGGGAHLEVGDADVLRHLDGRDRLELLARRDLAVVDVPDLAPAGAESGGGEAAAAVRRRAAAAAAGRAAAGGGGGWRRGLLLERELRLVVLLE